MIGSRSPCPLLRITAIESREKWKIPGRRASVRPGKVRDLHFLLNGTKLFYRDFVLSQFSYFYTIQIEIHLDNWIWLNIEELEAFYLFG